MTTTQPTENEQALIGLGRATERAAVIAWLHQIGWDALARRIEDGAHLDDETADR